MRRQYVELVVTPGGDLAMFPLQSYTSAMTPSSTQAPKSNTLLWIAGIGLAIAAVVYFGGKFFRAVTEALRNWEPDDRAEKETDHRKAVATFLRTQLPGYTIIEEYANERSRADLVICSSPEGVERSQEKFVLELKYRLASKAEVDRLIGQCVGYKQFGYDKVILLIIDTEPNMAEVLKARASVDVLAGFLTILEIRKASPVAPEAVMMA
jgi:hypothetical protein